MASSDSAPQFASGQNSPPVARTDTVSGSEAPAEPGKSSVAAFDAGQEFSALPHAILWDMDGTLVDTEIHWFAAEAELMRAHGVPWSHEDSMTMLGSSEADMVAYMQSLGLELTGERISAELYARVLEGIRNDLPLRPGAVELLVAALQAGVPTALVTNSGSELATAVTEHLLHHARGLGWNGEGLFDVVVTGDLAALPGKPDPAPYVFAARRLHTLFAERGRPGLEIGSMVAIEDSGAGLESAWKAGAVTVGVANHADLDQVRAHVKPASLAHVTLDDLGRWVTEARLPSEKNGESRP